ncbi:hypothetical protein HDU86_004370 [Geranomyces michiganensis]|nr:hypothetical protein HDU86_004370 [Geranomyces michiganensis]
MPRSSSKTGKAGNEGPFNTLPPDPNQRNQSPDMYKRFKKAKYADQFMTNIQVPPTQTWAPGSGPSSASLDGTHSPLDETIVETETGDDFDVQAPMPAISSTSAGYAVDPTALHRQLTSLSYQGVNNMSGVYPPQRAQYQPSEVQGWAVSDPSLAGYPTQGPPSDQPLPVTTIMSRSLSDQSMSQKPSRRGSMAQTTEMLGTLSMGDRDNAFLAPTGQTSRRGSLIPPPAPLRTAGPPQLSLFEPSNMPLTQPTAFEYDGKRPNGGWSFVPQGYIPVLFPAHAAANAEILQMVQKHGGVFSTVSHTKAAPKEDGRNSREKSTSKSKESSVVPAETEPNSQPKVRKPPPRPANSFILYRRAKQDEVMKSNDGMANSEISRLIGQMWINESPEVKELYKAKADDAKRLHNITFPDYKYAPRKQVKGKKQSTVESGRKRSMSDGSPDYRFPESSRTSGRASRADLTEGQRSPSPHSPRSKSGQNWHAGPVNPGEGQMYAVPYPGYFHPPAAAYPAYQPVMYQQAYHETDTAYREGRAFQYPVQSPRLYGYPGYIPAPPHPSHEGAGMVVRAQSAPPARPHLGAHPQHLPGGYGMPMQQYQLPQQMPRQYSYHASPGPWQENPHP